MKAKCRACLLRLVCLKRMTMMRALLCVVLLSVATSLIFSYHLVNSRHNKRSLPPPQPEVICLQDPDVPPNFTYESKEHRTKERNHLGRRALIIVETQYTRSGTRIRNVLDAWRIDTKVETIGNNLPTLTHGEKGKFAVIVFENYATYLTMDTWNRQLLDKYCKNFNVGIIGFLQPKGDSRYLEQLEGFPLSVEHNVQLSGYKLNIYSEMWRISRPGRFYNGWLGNDPWSVFHFNSPTYQPLSYSYPHPSMSEDSNIGEPNVSIRQKALVPAIHDTGQLDGIQRILFGGGLDFWLHHIMLMDCLSYISHGKLSMPLERYIQVDIDDIFVGKEGYRLKVEDVMTVLEAQKYLQSVMDGFRFNLGFSGRYYLHGDPEEDAGDKKLLEYKHHFWWFGHMFRHEQAHTLNQEQIEESMLANKNFAKVLPRQTCGLFTHTNFVSDFINGLSGLEENFKGGELFITILYSPFNIFMTHMNNYANDRVAVYTFEGVVKFIKCWTNLRLLSVPPLQLGIEYFNMFPEEKDPLWQNPCDNKRHLAIWSANKSCERLPKFLVVGPQKTGTTALYTFLSMHPAIKSNANSQTTFEEVQFFNGNNYYKGIDWYMEFFPLPANSSGTYLFEKSATYFDKENVPQRVFSLIPRAKIICILIDPAKRAYSWYQHQRAHNDPVALNYSFNTVLMADEHLPRQVRELRSRCLDPGTYAQHLMRWLDYFSARQVFIIDGEQLRNNPVHVLHKLQQFLHIQPYFDYSQHLRYDPHKGFFCQVLGDNRNKCLGRGKGRTYEPMDEESSSFLRHYYRKHNVNLSKLLSKLNYPVPPWLQDMLGDEV